MLNALTANLLSTPQRQAWTNLLFREQEVINLTTIVWTAKKDTGLPDTRSNLSSCQQGQVSCGLWWAGLVTRMLVRDMERG